MNSYEQVVSKINWQKATDGLVPAIVQHSRTEAVLMMAWMNQDSIQQTIDSGKVTFFSRSRQSIWVKGETSGNFLDFVSLTVDCDGDTLLVQAYPFGPACHTGQETCFGAPNNLNFSFLNELQEIIDERQSADPKSSYTASLLSGPFHRIAQKVGEEAVETILAGTSRDLESLVDESADLLFHLMVMLQAKNVSLNVVVDRLAQRHANKR